VGAYLPGDSMDWIMDGTHYGASQSWPQITDTATHSVQLVVSRTGVSNAASNIATGAAGTW
jgi:hypothetical protein